MLQILIFILTIIVVLVPYFIMLNISAERLVSKAQIPLLAVVMLFVYICGLGFIMKLYELFNRDNLVIYLVFAFGAILSFSYMIRSLIKFWSMVNKVVLGVLFLYVILILTLTIFIRIGNREMWMRNSQLKPFSFIEIAVVNNNYGRLTDFVRNILVFIPFGVMIPLLDRIRYKRPGFTLLYAGIFSTGIELTQHITHLGMFDLDDIIANVTGAFIGYLFCFVVLLLVEKPQKETRHAARTAA